MTLKEEVLAYTRRTAPSNGLKLTENVSRLKRFAELPDEVYQLAEQQAGAGATFADKLRQVVAILEELVKVATTADSGATKPTKPVQQTDHGKDTGSAPTGAKASEGASADVLLAKAAGAIKLAEGVDFGQALGLARQRDPALAERYNEANFGAPDPTPHPTNFYADQVLKHYTGVPADVLKTLANALAAADKAQAEIPVQMSESAADHLVRMTLAEASEDAAADAALALSEVRSDVLMAAVSKHIAASEGIGFGEAMKRAATRFPQVHARYKRQED
jgi:hypothetical protein